MPGHGLEIPQDTECGFWGHSMSWPPHIRCCTGTCGRGSTTETEYAPLRDPNAGAWDSSVTAGGNAPFETGCGPPSLPGTDPVHPQDDSAIVPGGLDEIAEVQLSLCARCDMYRHPLRVHWLPDKLSIFIQAL
jgi:hypothetical protein